MLNSLIFTLFCFYSSKAYCVMGKCLEFGKDMTPKYKLSNETLTHIRKIVVRPRSLRFKRELYIEPPKLVAVNQTAIQDMIEGINLTHFNGGSIDFYHDDIGEIAFDDPIGK